MSIEIDLSGHRALVTGSGRGIGASIAVTLARAGAEVILCSRNAEALNETSERIRAAGGTAHVAPADLSSTDAIRPYYDAVVSSIGRADILVNNAGINLRSPAAETDLATWRQVMAVNLDAVFFLSQAFFHHLAGSGSPGAIVNIASLLSEAARPTIAPYTASKGGIRQLTKALAVEWAPHDITVNAVGPGYIATEMTRGLKDDPAFNDWVLGRTPLKRWGVPSDIAGAVLFLASGFARFITGQILYVDGGWLASL
ncbi:MAG: glucose 1-dehydrogenase [Planctomycetes bacterium]|nr:glucose 1-dehydrogenase [Planctomycetota bacterium]